MTKSKSKQTLKKIDVLKATGIAAHNFDHWVDRRIIPLSGDDELAPRGKPRGYGLRTVLKISIAHRISRLGIPANIAVRLASEFTDKPQAGREIGRPFPCGKTMLIATPDGQGKVVRVQADQNMTEHFQDATLAVDVGQIFNETLSRIAIK